MKLSDRLQMIAEQIKKGETMADIGTDHGFLPIYLWENTISPRLILTDISCGSLKKAVENVRRYIDKDADKMPFDFRQGNGIRILKNAETDVLVIAGMGGTLISEILGDDIKKSRSFKKIILQPRNAQGKLRFWLLTNGFEIKKELLVREGMYICEVIVAVPKDGFADAQTETGKNAHEETKKENYRDICSTYNNCENFIAFEAPETLFRENSALALELFQKKLEIEKFIYSKLKSARNINSDKILLVQKRIDYLEKMIIGERAKK